MTCGTKLSSRYHAQIAARHQASGADLLEANSRREKTADCEELQAEDIFFCTVGRKRKHEQGFHPAVMHITIQINTAFAKTFSLLLEDENMLHDNYMCQINTNVKY